MQHQASGGPVVPDLMVCWHLGHLLSGLSIGAGYGLSPVEFSVGSGEARCARIRSIARIRSKSGG